MQTLKLPSGLHVTHRDELGLACRASSPLALLLRPWAWLRGGGRGALVFCFSWEAVVIALTLGLCKAGGGVSDNCSTSQALLSPKYGTVAADTL